MGAAIAVLVRLANLVNQASRPDPDLVSRLGPRDELANHRDLLGRGLLPLHVGSCERVFGSFFIENKTKKLIFKSLKHCSKNKQEPPIK